MGTERRQLKVMLWKNWLLKVRHPFVTCAEILLPTVVMMLLIDVRMRVHTQIHPAQPYIRNGVFVEVGKGISPNFEKVLELLLNQEEFLAFAPDTEETRSMINIMSVKFPLLKCVSRVCKDEQELETYIHSDLYGTANQIPNCSNPKIRGAVVFHDQGPQSFDYSIRLNHTWAFSGFPDVKSIMDVNGPYLNDLELGLNAVPTMQYSSGGFVTLPQVLDSFIIFAAQQSDTKDIELPSSATLSSGEPSFLSIPWMLYGPSNIRIVPFPSREYTDDEFQSIIKAVMGVLYLLGSLYPISRLISYLVFEKDLDAFSAAVIVSIASSFIPSSFAVPIVKECEVKAKHQQLISGVSVLSSSVFYSFMLGFYFHMGLHQLPFSLIVCNNSFLHLWSGAVHWKRIFIVNSYHVFNVWISNCIIHILPYNFLL